MTLIAVLATAIMTFLLTFPAFLVGAVFGEFIGQPIFAAFWGPGLGVVVSVAFAFVIPALLVGATAGGLGIWLTRKAFGDADWGKASLGAAAIMVAYAVIAPLVVDGVSGPTVYAQTTAIVIAYLIVGMRAMDDDDTRKGWFQTAARGLMVVAVAECFFMPLLIVKPLEASDDLPVFQPVTPEDVENDEPIEEDEDRRDAEDSRDDGR